MSSIGRKITAIAVAVSLGAVPTTAIATNSAAPPAVTQLSSPTNPWVTLSAMTTSSSAAAVATQGESGGAGFPPIAPLVVILATIAVAVYIATKDDNDRLDLDLPISPA